MKDATMFISMASFKYTFKMQVGVTSHGTFSTVDEVAGVFKSHRFCTECSDIHNQYMAKAKRCLFIFTRRPCLQNWEKVEQENHSHWLTEGHS